MPDVPGTMDIGTEETSLWSLLPDAMGVDGSAASALPAGASVSYHFLS